MFYIEARGDNSVLPSEEKNLGTNQILVLNVVYMCACEQHLHFRSLSLTLFELSEAKQMQQL